MGTVQVHYRMYRLSLFVGSRDEEVGVIMVFRWQIKFTNFTWQVKQDLNLSCLYLLSSSAGSDSWYPNRRETKT